MKQQAPEEPGICKHQCAILLEENQVVVLAKAMIRAIDRQAASHTQVHPQPGAVAETKDHLFASRFRGDDFGAAQGPLEEGSINSAEDPLACEHLNARHPIPEPRVPLAAEVLDFGKFRHWWTSVHGANRSMVHELSGCRA